MSKSKQIIGGPLEIDGRVLTLSRAIRAGDFVFLTGQIPMQDGVPMTTGTIEDQTRAVLEDMPVSCFKIGMIGSAENVEAIHSILIDYPDIPVVLDPVLAGWGPSVLFGAVALGMGIRLRIKLSRAG